MRWVAVAALVSCMPSYTFEPPPLGAPTASDTARCYEAKRFALVQGEGSWWKQFGSGRDIITITYGQDGVALYRGTELARAEDVIPKLPDAELAKGYAHVLDMSEHDSVWYPRYRTAAFALALGGLGLVTSALVIVLTDSGSDLTQPLMYSGAALALLSVIPTVLSSRTYDGAVQHDLALTMFTQADWGTRMEAAVAQANQALAAQCGYSPSDVPESASAKRMLGH